MQRKVRARFLGLLVIAVIAVGFGAQSLGTVANPAVVTNVQSANGQSAVPASMDIEWASVGTLAVGALIMFLWPRHRRQVEETDL